MASVHNAMLFKSARNYPINGVPRVTERGATTLIYEMTDNDFHTFSAENDVDIAISDAANNATRVDAVYVISTGVTASTGTPTGGTGTGWTSRATPTDVTSYGGATISTEVNGLTHDFYLLPTEFTATSVRLRFSGSSPQIYQILFLEFVLEFDVNKNETEAFDAAFVDRSGQINPVPGGGIVYSGSFGNSRPRLEIEYGIKVIPNKTINQNATEFVYKLHQNRNCVFAQEPSRYPERVFVSSVISDSISVTPRGDYKPSGDLVSFSVGEQ